MRELVNVMKALSDPGRVKVLKMLEGRELCACEIIGLLGLAQPTVSRHLKVLVDAGLIVGRKVGSWVHYRLALGPDAASPYAQSMLATLPGWLEDDPEIKSMRQALGGLAPLAINSTLADQREGQQGGRQDCCDTAKP
ncbi:MAG: metalloregulator ArsR/SmtB family transcription factor [Humidesulfovibrio sp.]|uniref:ArsR/SmtB family transcription factor n=1 Tax=Humidesulfovibrio sp. TaxID=2910988 RepID=UPI0027E6DF0D|nr:metalloregulator ArsR/SmtB family transcription factor [Humidesulfovibrio sp.]MDQ7836468.1 metalloregulator ArsR/SmtB family transcription factor [Humidesulfovibrio sp.]